jgi:hypothetical protein
MKLNDFGSLRKGRAWFSCFWQALERSGSGESLRAFHRPVDEDETHEQVLNNERGTILSVVVGVVVRSRREMLFDPELTFDCFVNLGAARHFRTKV